MFNGSVGGDSFRAAKVAAVAAFTQRFDLNMVNFTDVAVAVIKMRPLEIIRPRFRDGHAPEWSLRNPDLHRSSAPPAPDYGYRDQRNRSL